MRQIRQEINLEQQQKLYMTTELRQAISLLQMPALELNEYILSKIAENPFLDEEEIKEEGIKDESNDGSLCDQKTTYTIDDLIEHFQEGNISAGWNEKYEKKSWERYLYEKPSLYEHLECQLHLEVSNSTDLMIGNYLIGNIDNNGYLCADTNEVAEKLNVDVARVEKILKLVQSFQPPGIGARNLQECLQLQLIYSSRNSPLTEKILQYFLQELAERKFSRIASVLGVSVQKVQEVYDLITTLNPKPGLQYGTEKNPLVWPDVTVIKDQGKYLVIVNDLEFARLKINHLYANQIRQAASLSEEVKKYLDEKFEAALGLVRGIEQRRLNIYKVVQCIVDIQSEFLDKGIEYLKPLSMSQVAELVNIHESTVSRVTANKYVQTPRGMFALKYFFNSGVDSLNQEKICSKSIKHMIAEIINQEDPETPLRDQEIVEILVKRGINISRRTVNKYRQSIGIPSHLLRRRY